MSGEEVTARIKINKLLVANLVKHGRLTKPPRRGHIPAFDSVSGASVSGGEWRLVLSICHGNDRHDGLKRAIEVIEAWRLVLAGWKII